MTLDRYPGLSLAKAPDKVTIYRQQIEDEIDPRIGESDQQKKLAFREVTALAPKPRDTNQSAIHPSEAFEMLAAFTFMLNLVITPGQCKWVLLLS